MGDIVTIGNTTGVVSQIRIRATIVRSWDQQELLVPNKALITGHLLNWTLSDRMNRIVICAAIWTPRRIGSRSPASCIKTSTSGFAPPASLSPAGPKKCGGGDKAWGNKEQVGGDGRNPSAKAMDNGNFWYYAAAF